MLKEKISGQRITLERPSLDMRTAQTVFAAVDKSRNAFSPWLDWVEDTRAPEDVFRFLQEADQGWKDGSQFVYAIYCRKTFMGLISAINISRKNKRAEIGYWLGTEYTGKGFMAEAVSLLERELFADNFNRVVIHTDVLNAKSAGVAKRCGYVLEGVMRQERYVERQGRFRDTNVFSKLRADLK